ncbi:sulfur carrier protein ThiS [uncultured Cedecea sp.]|uniref:sulfur carrier protein ThiS n=1 Tax=uncultured Cedecea sp. TaxID=988762 RepID=UPI00261C3165|nr:sulfur carrier protein ThiS [uncultured Cedecea sp.]
MQILFNEEPLQCRDALVLSELLTELGKLQPGSALAVNQTIIPRSQWGSLVLQDGDAILLFQAIAGG